MSSKRNLTWGCCMSGGEDENNYIQCFRCKKAFHNLCLSAGSIKQAQLTDKVKDWLCPRCHEKTPKSTKNDNTPVRLSQEEVTRPGKRQALSSPPSKYDSPITREEMREIIEEVLKKQITELKKQFTNEQNVIKEELKNVNKAMEFMSNQFEDLMKKYNESQDLLKSIKEREIQMQSKITALENRMSLLEQSARSKNVEIQSVPEKKSENLIGIVKELGNIVGHELNEDNIIRTTRTAKLNPESKRPRSIIVEFNNPRVRDTFLAATIKFNRNKSPNEKLNSSHLGYSGPRTSVFVAEHLSPQNKALHAAARRAAKERAYKFVWVRGGRIFMRKNEDSGYIFVRDMSTLAGLK